MNELVKRLSEGDHPVVSGCPDATAEKVKAEIDRGYVHVKFTGTRGGTNIGCRLVPEATDVSGADFEASTGMIHVEGTLTLNYVPVKCVADIDLSTMEGTGHLVITEENEKEEKE